MLLRPAHLPLGLSLLAVALAAEETTREPAPRSTVRSLLLEKLKMQAGPFQAPPPTPEPAASPVLTAAAAVQKPPPEVVLLEPYLVVDRAGPSLTTIEQGMRKADDLKSKALLHKDLKSGTRVEFLLPPTEGSKGGFALPMLRLSW
jgi:hypothetical protein